MRYRASVVCFLAIVAASVATVRPVVAMESEVRHFTVGENRLAGLLSRPDSGDARALVIIVHGYGATNVVELNGFYELRTRLASIGVASFVWDKPGSGRSEGEFDLNQPVASSAKEVVVAAQYLRATEAPGSERIGLWGRSRAGWIAPIALSQDPDLAFWVSVSGVDSRESFGYLLESNWRLQGYSEERISLLLAQWKAANIAMTEGKSFSEVMTMTADYRADPFVLEVAGGESAFNEQSFEKNRATWQRLSPTFDPETGLMVYVEDFDELLSKLNVPVLALFGEKDSIVDWRSAKALYEQTIGQNPNASLAIRTFPDGDHNLHKSETGGYREMIEALGNPEPVDGYYDVVLDWLSEHVLQAGPASGEKTSDEPRRAIVRSGQSVAERNCRQHRGD